MFRSSSFNFQLTQVAAGPALTSTAAPHSFVPLTCLQTCTVVRTFASRKKKGKMAPKKQVKEEKILLGRPGNNLKSGIVCANFLPHPKHSVFFVPFCVLLLQFDYWNDVLFDLRLIAFYWFDFLPKLIGWLSECWEVYSLSSNHKMLVG